jgi:hypothetical protein
LILLEVLGKRFWGRIVEIPFTFKAKEKGTIKLEEQTMVEYAKQIIDFAGFAIRNKNSPGFIEFTMRLSLWLSA